MTYPTNMIETAQPEAGEGTILTAKPAKSLYAQLKHRIREKGLMERQPVYSAQKIGITAILFGLGIGLMILGTTSIWLMLLAAVYMAFAFVQIGFIAHDVGHRQVFRKPWQNDVVGYVCGNLILGMSYSWWVDKHNAHHSNPNQFDMDPDIDIPLLAFSQEQALSRRGIARLIVKYQTWLFFPLLTLSSASVRAGSHQFLFIQRKAKKPVLETVLIVVNLVLSLGFVFWLYGFWPGLLFIVVQQALFGLYMASVFAPNHKGMLTLEKDDEMDFLRQQVLTARNVKASPFIDFWYGGLNYQIEHHLFPNMPRNKLRESQQVVIDFCKEHNISYHETGMVQSYVEILESLHEMSAPLRQTPAQAAI